MKSILSNIFLESYPYFNKLNNISLVTALKIVDLLLLEKRVKVDGEEYVIYVNTYIELNKFLINFLNLDDSEKILFDESIMNRLKNLAVEKREEKLNGFKNNRMLMYEKNDKDLVDYIQSLKDSTKAA